MMIDQTSIILQLEYENFKEIRHSLDEVIDQVATLNIVVSNWPTYFTSTFNKLKSQRSVLEDLTKKKKMTPESRMRTTLATQIDKEKELEVQLTQQEREWFKREESTVRNQECCGTPQSCY
jgi:hypothetical protein